MQIKNMALIIYSGGLDSTVLLHLLKSRGQANGALCIRYGQKHAKEIEFARYNCRKLGVELTEADLTSLQSVFGQNALTDAAIAVPHGNYDSKNMASTVVPNRNMIFMAVAAARAIAIGQTQIAYAAHAGDHAIYPDCRPQFAEAMDSALALCHYEPIKLYRPFIDMTKADIVKLGASLGVDFSKTWSCYEGGDIHCGKCGTCRERHEAFEIAKVKDPTLYANK